MKNNWIAVFIFGFVGIIVLFFILAIFRSQTSTNNAAKATQTSDTVSTDRIYFQSASETLDTLPHNTVTSAKYPGVSIYWVENSESYGNDTCTLYDDTTNQIYASRYRSNGQTGGRGIGSMYYVNSAIKQDKAKSFLDNACFKNS